MTSSFAFYRPLVKGPLTLAERDLYVLLQEDLEELWQPTWWMDDDELDLPDHTWAGGFTEPVPSPLSQIAETDRRPSWYHRPSGVLTRPGPRVWMRGPFAREVTSRRDSADWRRLLRHGYVECGELPPWTCPYALAEWLILSGRVEGAVHERRMQTTWMQPYYEAFHLEWLIDQAVDGCDLACVKVLGGRQLMWLE